MARLGLAGRGEARLGMAWHGEATLGAAGPGEVRQDKAILSMETTIKGKRDLFTAEELDVLICALIRQQTEWRSRLPIMQKFASPEHLASHQAKIAVGEQLLKDLSS